MTMKRYDPKRPLISIHVPKCGGTTFRAALKEWFPDKRLHFHYFIDTRSARPTRIRLRKGPFGLQRRRHICIHGFFNRERGAGVFDYYPGANQFITILRDPLELHLSHYFYLRKKHPEGAVPIDGAAVPFQFESADHYLDTTGSYMLLHLPWPLRLDNYCEMLERTFIHIGVTERMQQSVNAFADRLGKPKVEIERVNITARDETPSPEAVQRWRERHRLEYAIYEYARGLNE